MPYHKQEDAAREQSRRGRRIGTTRRGIGPTYADKMQRATAVRVADLMHEEKLKQKIGRIVTERNKVLKVLYDAPPLDWKEIFEQYRDFGRRMQPFVDDVGHTAASSSAARASGSSSKARTPCCSTSTTARTRTSPARSCSALGPVHRRRRAAADRAELRRHHEGLQHARRRRAVPDRAGQRHRQLHPRARQRVRHDHRAARAAAAGSTRWPSGTPSTSAASRTSR